MADNHIRRLPADMSAMSQVEEINLNGNPIDDIISAVDTIRTMPNLKSLQINLHEEDQVDYLLRTLSYLEQLNGLAVEREALFNEEDEEGEDEQENSRVSLDNPYAHEHPSDTIPEPRNLPVEQTSQNQYFEQ